MKKYFLILFLTSCSLITVAQKSIRGKVLDFTDKSPLPGVSISVLGSNNGTISDEVGAFEIKIPKFPATISFKSVGFQEQKFTVINNHGLLVELKSNTQMLDDMVVTGSRYIQRTVMDSPVPIDMISSHELISTGQPTVDKMLMYKVPSYNSSTQAVSDATAHFDPADLRGMGPSRTLVLINGKRKNASSLVYINDTPGKGEVGVDMKSIPAYAIEKIEVLRDGASAQYGSDAIAGVINVVLKKNIEYSSINLFGGVTSKGDGVTYGFNANTGTNIGKKGFLTLTADYSDQQATNRAGSPGKDTLISGVNQNTPFFGSWVKDNPSLGMKVGQPNMATRDAFYNLSLPVGENGMELYSFGGITYRKGLSYAVYRTPYWVTDPYNIFHDAGTTYQGFQPTFGTDILDHTFAVGVKGIRHHWNYDLSVSNGANQVDYTVGNTLNISLGTQSPTTFNAGGYSFKSTVSNLDFSRKFDFISLGFGTEFRNETYVSKAGEPNSYYGSGSQSFPGIQPANASSNNRYNVGFYTDINIDINENFMIGGAARHEKYSDFGDNFSWKANGRLKLLNDVIVLRGSYSTGFRAPSLQQLYLSTIQTTLSNGTISNQATFNNESSAIRSLGVQKLSPELSTNITGGITINPFRNFNISADYYDIKVDHRIVYSSSISSKDPNSAVGKILTNYNVTSFKFFANAVNTRTKGYDAVISYSNIEIGDGKLSLVASGNFNKIKIDSNIASPSKIANSNAILFDRKEQSRILTGRPNSKILAGLAYDTERLRISINATRFGEVKWQHVDNGLNASIGKPDSYFDQTFKAKIITDLHAEFKINEAITVSGSVNNIFDIYPDIINTKGDYVTNLGGRFKYPWEVNQFGINGRTYQTALKFKF